MNAIEAKELAEKGRAVAAKKRLDQVLKDIAKSCNDGLFELMEPILLYQENITQLRDLGYTINQTSTKSFGHWYYVSWK